jgi:hypothetical protein
LNPKSQLDAAQVSQASLPVGNSLAITSDGLGIRTGLGGSLNVNETDGLMLASLGDEIRTGSDGSLNINGTGDSTVLASSGKALMIQIFRSPSTRVCNLVFLLFNPIEPSEG